MFHRLTVTLIALLALAAVSGCVYYNTFYHATEAAREAELMRQARPPGTDPSPAEAELLDRVVEKCGRVIRLHPDSDWADDALVLMGEALYRQKKYDSAEERFTEFVTHYPESELRPKAEYYLAAVLIAKGNAVAAEEILSEVAYADPPSELSDDALFLIGDARRKRKRYAEAAEIYRELLDRFPRSDRRAEVRYVAADNFIDMGRLEEAASELSAVANEKSTRELAFEARLKRAGVLVDLGKTDEALSVLEELERRATSREDIDRILLARGRTYEAIGDFEGAMGVYDQLASEHERSDAAAEALYRIGLIYRDRMRDFDEAIASFREAKEQAPRSDTAALAASAISDIEELREYLAVIEEHEREGEPESSTATGDAGRTREDSLGVTPLEPPARAAEPPGGDRAGVSVRDSASASPRAGAPEASSVADSTISTAAEIVAPAEEPDESWSPWPPPAGPMPAVTASPVEPQVVFEEDSEEAIARFRVAELYLFKLGSPSEALPYYESVIEEHPKSSLAPRAAYAVAWIAENRTGDLAAAEDAYRRVVERFPGTGQAEEAAKALARLESGGSDVGDDAGATERDVGEPVTDARDDRAERPSTPD